MGWFKCSNCSEQHWNSNAFPEPMCLECCVSYNHNPLTGESSLAFIIRQTRRMYNNVNIINGMSLRGIRIHPDFCPDAPRLLRPIHHNSDIVVGIVRDSDVLLGAIVPITGNAR